VEEAGGVASHLTEEGKHLHPERYGNRGYCTWYS
jgi:hypothetical protein